jgi:hypothetical protein
MSPVYFVEILNHSGDVQTRHKFTELPIRIGRAYSNDIILDDPHTAADHAIIESDDNSNIIIRDLGSDNGIKLKGKRQQQYTVHGDNIFNLGHTRIRIRTSTYIVSAEIGDLTNHSWEGWPLLFTGITIIALLSFSNTWLSDISDSKATTYIMNISTWLGASAVWAALWALANRVFGGNTHFSRHLFTLSCGLLALDLFDYLCGILAYGFSWEIFTRYSSHLEIAILATTVYYHLRHISPRQRTRLKIVCTSLLLIGSSLMLMRNYQSINQYSDELYMREMLPPSWRFSSNHSIAEFGKATQELKAEIEAERDRTLKEKADAKK